MSQIIIQPGAELVTQEGIDIQEEKDTKIVGDFLSNYSISISHDNPIIDAELGATYALYKGPLISDALLPFLGKIHVITAIPNTPKFIQDIPYLPLSAFSTPYGEPPETTGHRARLVAYGAGYRYFGILEECDEGVNPYYEGKSNQNSGALYEIHFIQMTNLQLTEHGFGTYGKTNTWKSILGG